MKIGIVSDIHEDIVMLEKAMHAFESIGCDLLACLGDITGFSGRYYSHGNTHDAHKCITILKNHFKIIVKGNHDLFVAKQVPQFPAGVHYPGNWFDLSIEAKKAVSHEKVWLYEDDDAHNLTDEDVYFLCNVPEYFVFDAGAYKILFSHYIFPDFTGSVKKFHSDVYDFLPHLRFMNENNIKTSFCGHFHGNRIQIASSKGIKKKKPGKVRLKDRIQCVISPAVASGKGFKGVMVFDTANNELDILKLKA